MTVTARLAWAGLVRAPWRTIVRILVLAGAVGLLGAMLLFIAHSLSTMTGSATRSVPLDWQGPVGSQVQAERVAGAVARQPGIAQASAAATAPFAAAAHHAAVGEIRAGAGSVLAVAPGELRHIKIVRFLNGTLGPGGIVLDQQLAATLQARVGDRVTLTPRPGGRPLAFRVTGVAIVTAPDVVFQPLDPLLGPAPAQPPANVAVMPLRTFADTLAPSLRTITPATAGSAAVPGAQDGVQWQVHAQLDPGALGSTPGQALTRATRTRNRVERGLPGQVQFVDNLSDALNTAAGDALYAQALFIMLAVPGALVALGLAWLAALGAAERDRRELALLRARGAGRRDLLAMAAIESLAIGVVAGLLGAAVALLAVRALVSGGIALTAGRAGATLGACVGLAVLGAAAARVGAGLSVARASVTEGRRSARRASRPLWERLYLDFACLASAGLVYWLTARTGFSAVINPDSNPTLSLAVYMFFAPALLWVGATLLLVRLRGRAVGWLLRSAARGRARDRRGFLLVSAGRRASAINRGLVVVGLLLAFGVQLGLFAATYDRQARVDAQLTLGADVVATAPPGVVTRADLAAAIGRIPGVAATTPVDHSYAYVGPDLQDTFGIDPGTFTRATSLRDSYFLGGSAGQVLARLAARRDGILVSRETITDYGLRLGDLLRLRVLDRRSGTFRVAPFHVVGVVQEFPSAPRDSFMVANLSYLRSLTHDAGPNVVLAKASGDPARVAARVAHATRATGTTVSDITKQTRQTVSSITTVDLTGIARIEEAFVVALAAAAMALFVALEVSERRVELATMAAVGAPSRDVAAFVWTEAALVLVAGLALGAGLGWLLAEMLVAMLRHVFDPPPDSLALPWGYLGQLVLAATAGAAGAIALALVGLRRMPLGAVLREQ